MVRGLTVVRASVPASRGGTANGIGRCHGGEHGIAGRDRGVLGGLVGQNKFGNLQVPLGLAKPSQRVVSGAVLAAVVFPCRSTSTRP